jgi:cell division protease FtsH
MVMRYGMYDEIGQENFAGERGMGNYTGIEGERPFVSESTQKAIDSKVREILTQQYQRAMKLIQENKKLHEKISEDLLQKEEMDRVEFEAYFS